MKDAMTTIDGVYQFCSPRPTVPTFIFSIYSIESRFEFIIPY